MSIPEGATHKGELGRYYKCVEGQWFYSNNFGHWRKYYSGRPANLIALEKKHEWSGPQDGLPPVGSSVEICAVADEYAPDWNRYADHIGRTATIIAHQEAQSSQPIAVYSCEIDGRYEYHSLVAHCFKQASTPEQIIQEQRETAIREIMDIADVDCRVTAAKLVDAGFKREVV